ncbi:hypothetical protein B0H10DRAFT_1956322 [Mycena sp. CBHHK59/15]|nr:hypothetical protein B0H10DRAFT_1956322 [Mycena sp. CBHHK59/15]
MPNCSRKIQRLKKIPNAAGEGWVGRAPKRLLEVHPARLARRPSSDAETCDAGHGTSTGAGARASQHLLRGTPSTAAAKGGGVVVQHGVDADADGVLASCNGQRGATRDEEGEATRQNEKRGIGVDGGAAASRPGGGDAGLVVKRGRRGGAAIARAGDVDVDGGAVRAEMDAGDGVYEDDRPCWGGGDARMREADEGGGAGDAGEAGERGEDLRSGGTARRNNSRRWGRAARKGRSMGVAGDTDVVLASLLKSKTDVLRFAMVQTRGRATAVRRGCGWLAGQQRCGRRGLVTAVRMSKGRVKEE